MSHSPHGLIASRPCQKERPDQCHLHAGAGENQSDSERHDDGKDERVLLRILLGLLLHRRWRLLGCWSANHRRLGHSQGSLVLACHNAAGHNVPILPKLKLTEEVGSEGRRALLTVDVPQELQHVGCVHCACLRCKASWQVTVANDGYSILCGVDLILLGHCTIATSQRCQVHNDRASLHVFDHVVRDKCRRWPARNGSRGDDDVHFLGMPVKSLTLCLHELLGAFFSIAARSASILLEVHLHPLATHGLNLVVHITYIPRAHYGAHGTGSSDGSQTCDPTAQDEGV
mmetsp:Transcript_97014/g.178281  ORF Transcript_97014/g.178281 Transcript_97014/m.178281 type:complete len:287 (-) Transcript_97014:392-1252(-)